MELILLLVIAYAVTRPKAFQRTIENLSGESK